MSGTDYSEVEALNDEEKEYKEWNWRRETHLIAIWFLLVFATVLSEGVTRHTFGVIGILFTFYCLWWVETTTEFSWRNKRGKRDSQLDQFTNYNDLVALKGCGHRTAERILAKVDAGQTLTVLCSARCSMPNGSPQQSRLRSSSTTGSDSTITSVHTRPSTCDLLFQKL